MLKQISHMLVVMNKLFLEIKLTHQPSAKKFVIFFYFSKKKNEHKNIHKLSCVDV